MTFFLILKSGLWGGRAMRGQGCGEGRAVCGGRDVAGDRAGGGSRDVGQACASF